MDNGAISQLLGELSAPGSEAWRTFLRQFSPVLKQVIVFSFDDLDQQADCFVFVCEKLAENDFRRLRKFRCEGRASFPTWLRAVVRNLCLDWGRRNYGRTQAFAWTKQLSALDQQVFHYIYERGYKLQHVYLQLLPSSPGITEADVEKSAAQLASRLSAHERWRLRSRLTIVDSIDESNERCRALFELSDDAPNPERLAIEKENRHAVAAAMKKLPAQEQLLLRLRYEQDLTLQEIARVAGFKDAQAADRKIRSLLDDIRKNMRGVAARVPGKTKAASV